MRKLKRQCDVIGIDETAAFRKSMADINAQRHCMRISDHNWRQMKRRARTSNRPYAEALKGELDRYSHVILSRLTDLRLL